MSSVSIPVQLSSLLPQTLSNQIVVASGIEVAPQAAPVLPLSPAAGLRLSGLSGAQALGLPPPRGGLDLDALLASVTAVLQEAVGSNEAVGQEGAITALRQTLADSRTQIEATESLSGRIEQDIESRDARKIERTQATTELAGLATEVEQARGQIGRLQSDIATNNAAVALNLAQIGTLEASLRNANNIQKPAIEGQISALRERNAQIEALNRTLSNDIAEHSRKIAEHAPRITQLEGHIAVLTTEIDRLDNRIASDLTTWEEQMDQMIDTALLLISTEDRRRKDDSHADGQPDTDLEEGLRAMIEATIDRDTAIVAERERAIAALDGAGGSGPLGDGVATRFGAIEAMQSRGAGFAATVEALVGLLARLDPEAMIRNAADLAASSQARTRIAM